MRQVHHAFPPPPPLRLGLVVGGLPAARPGTSHLSARVTGGSAGSPARGEPDLGRSGTTVPQSQVTYNHTRSVSHGRSISGGPPAPHRPRSTAEVVAAVLSVNPAGRGVPSPQGLDARGRPASAVAAAQARAIPVSGQSLALAMLTDLRAALRARAKGAPVPAARPVAPPPLPQQAGLATRPAPHAGPRAAAGRGPVLGASRRPLAAGTPVTMRTSAAGTVVRMVVPPSTGGVSGGGGGGGAAAVALQPFVWAAGLRAAHEPRSAVGPHPPPSALDGRVWTGAQIHPTGGAMADVYRG